MKHIFILLTIVVFFIGCGLMGSSKGETETPEKIHVPQKITVEIPTILQKTITNNQTKKMQHRHWYN